jgi:hypothetical protein
MDIKYLCLLFRHAKYLEYRVVLCIRYIHLLFATFQGCEETLLMEDEAKKPCT